MSMTHDPYLLQTHRHARIDTRLAKPNGVACTSSLMPLQERLTQQHRPASIEQVGRSKIARARQRRARRAGRTLALALAIQALTLLAMLSLLRPWD